jgi:hypothetical protein
VGPKNPFRRNNYGFTLGGPVSIPKVFNGRNRLFFMANFEVLRDVTVSQAKASVASDAMRAGNFSLTPGVQILYDPATRVYPTSGAASATPFPGNIIPTARIVAPAINLMKYWPQQTVPGFNASLSNNYINNTTSKTESTQFNQRIDFTENRNSTWFGRYSWGNDFSLSGGTFPNSGNYIPTTVRQSVIANTRNDTIIYNSPSNFVWGGIDRLLWCGSQTPSGSGAAEHVGIAPEVSAELAALYQPIAAGVSWAHRVPGTKIGDTVMIFGAGQRGIANSGWG